MAASTYSYCQLSLVYLGERLIIVLLTVDHGADSVEMPSRPELLIGLGRKVKCTAFPHMEYNMLMQSGVSDGTKGT